MKLYTHNAIIDFISLTDCSFRVFISVVIKCLTVSSICPLCVALAAPSALEWFNFHSLYG